MRSDPLRSGAERGLRGELTTVSKEPRRRVYDTYRRAEVMPLVFGLEEAHVEIDRPGRMQAVR